MKTRSGAAWCMLGALIWCIDVSGDTIPFGGGIEIEGWRYTPVVSGQAGQKAVHSFVGLLNPSIAAGSNVTAIWYVRQGGQWLPKAWASEPEWKVVESVKAELEIGPEFDDAWFIWGTPEGGEAAPVPEPYRSGFFFTDPIAELAQESPFRDVLVEALMALGYPVADVKFERTSAIADCPSDVVLASIAVGVESQLNISADGEAVARTALAQNCAALCIPWTWVSTPPGPWTCGPWGAYGAPVQFLRTTIGGVQVDCCYSSVRVCSQSQTPTHRCVDCSRATRVVTRTRTDTHTVCCDDTGTLTGSPPQPCTATATCFNSATPPGPATVPTTPGTPGAWPPPTPPW